MHNETFEKAVSRILAEDNRYPREAYALLPAALDHTVRALRSGRHEEGGDDRPQHVSGRQLSEGLRDYMLAEYGPFAKGLLDDLNIRSTDDIGNIVYNLIKVGAFGKTEEDKLEDFHAVYDFNEAFVAPYLCYHDDAELP